MSLQDNLDAGNRVLAQQQAANGLSSYGAAFLAKAMDPFHDCPLKVNGIPDQSIGKSIIREFTSMLTISRPDTFSAASTWEVQISSLPLGAPVHTCWGLQDNYQTLGLGTATSITTAGLLTVQDANQQANQGVVNPIQLCFRQGASTQANAKWWPDTNVENKTFQTAANTVARYSGLDIPFSYSTKLTSPWRLVASAFEVVNTTTAQFKNGVCTVYRATYEKDGLKQNRFFANSARTTIFRSEVNLAQLPFNEVLSTLNIDGALQWGAEEGCYVVVPLDPQEMASWNNGGDRTPLVFTNNSNYGSPHNVLCPTAAQVNDGAGALNFPPPNILTASETCVAHFTGLSPETTLQLKVKWVIEAIPDINDYDYYIANEMAPYDPVAMELYAHLVRALPAGCMVKDNPNGEWYARVMYMLADISAEVGGIIGMQFGQGALGVAAGRMVEKYARDYGDSLLAQQKASQSNWKL